MINPIKGASSTKNNLGGKLLKSDKTPAAESMLVMIVHPTKINRLRMKIFFFRSSENDVDANDLLNTRKNRARKTRVRTMKPDWMRRYVVFMVK
jgi:hypothetical protein